MIRQNSESSDSQRALAEELIDELHSTVKNLKEERIEVKKEMQYVSKYSSKQAWQNISESEVSEINARLAGLDVPENLGDEYARRFDVLVLNYQLGLLESAYSTDKYQIKLSSIGDSLLKKMTIDAVAAQKDLIEKTQTPVYWENINVVDLEGLRHSLRDLMKYLDKEQKADVVTRFEDTLDYQRVAERDLLPNYTSLKSYRDRVASYVRNNKDHMVIHKIQNNKQITEADLKELERILFEGGGLGSKDEYQKAFGEQPLGELVRNIMGLEVAAAQAVFAEFIQAGQLSADQMTFIEQIINHLTKNGVIDKSMLFEPPFTHIHDQGLFGVFDDDHAGEVIRLVDVVNGNAVAVGWVVYSILFK